MRFFGCLVLLIGLLRGLAAAVPMYINYQGVVSDNGIVLNGSKDIIFRVYDAEQINSGINILGRDIICSGVNITDGVFNAAIGPFSAGDLTKMAGKYEVWLEVEIESEKFRQRLTSAAFAFRADSARKADVAAGLDDNSVTSVKIKDGEVKATDLDPNALSAGNIGNIKTGGNIMCGVGKRIYLDGREGSFIWEGYPNHIYMVPGGEHSFVFGPSVNFSLKDLCPFSDNTKNLGNPTYYWGKIYYTSLVKIGGWGCFDDGVEMQDGSIVSPTQALMAIKKDTRGKKTPYGKHITDHRTLPKEVYLKAEITDKNGRKTEAPRDAKGYAVGAEDAEDVNAMISIMISAIKELTARVTELERRK